MNFSVPEFYKLYKHIVSTHTYTLILKINFIRQIEITKSTKPYRWWLVCGNGLEMK